MFFIDIEQNMFLINIDKKRFENIYENKFWSNIWIKKKFGFISIKTSFAPFCWKMWKWLTVKTQKSLNLVNKCYQLQKCHRNLQKGGSFDKKSIFSRTSFKLKCKKCALYIV